MLLFFFTSSYSKTSQGQSCFSVCCDAAGVDLIKEIDWKYQTRSHPVIGLTRHSSAVNTFPECRR